MPATRPTFSRRPRPRTRSRSARSGSPAKAGPSPALSSTRASPAPACCAPATRACCRTPARRLRRRGGRGARPPQPRPGRRRRALQAAELRGRADRHPRRGRDQRAPCRSQGHDERALPQGPRRQDPPRPARPGRSRASPAAATATATTSCAASARRRAARRGERRINAAEAAIVRRIFGDYAAGALAARDRRSAQCRGRARPVRRGVGRLDHPRQPAARHRHPQQRTLYRPAGLEPAALRQGPGDRQARVAAQSDRKPGSSRGAGAADH